MTTDAPPRLRADIVVRKSQVLVEKDRDTLQRQEADGRAYCAKRGFVVNSVIQEVISGYHVPIKKRKGFMQAYRNIQEGRTGHIVIARGDRWTREGAKVALTIQGEITDMGGKLHLLDIGEGEIDLSGEMAEGVFGILADTWKLESLRISKRVKKAVDDQVKSGARHGGVRPYGVHRAPLSTALDGPKPCPSCGAPMLQHEVRGTLVAKVEPCLLEMQRIQIMAEMKIAGRPIWQIVKYANAQGWPTASGKSMWRAQTIKGILTSPAIRGERSNRRGEPNSKAWEPVIPAKEHDALLSAVRTNKNTRRSHPSLLGGLKLLKCGRCEYYLGSRSHTGRGGKPRYACPSLPNAGMPGGPCQSCSAIQEHVDNRVIDLLADYLKHYVANPQQNSRDLKIADLSQRIAVAQRNLDELQDEWYGDSEDRRLTREQYDRLYDRNTSLLNDLTQELGEYRIEQKKNKSEANILPLPGDDPKAWFLAQSLDTQRLVLKDLLVSITLAPVGTKAGCKFLPERVTIQPKFAAALMIKSDREMSDEEEAAAYEAVGSES